MEEWKTEGIMSQFEQQKNKGRKKMSQRGATGKKKRVEK